MNFKQEHPDASSLLQFVSDELGEQEASEVSGHIDSCPDCQRSLETLVENDSYIAKTLRTSEPNSLSFRNEDHLLIIDEIASGGMGVVYRGYDRELKREVAIKVARDGERKSQEIRFYREAQISSQLQHPGIIPVYRIGKLKDGRQFIAMKVVQGQTLKQQIIDHHGGGDISYSDLIDVFQQVCQTIAYAHSKGIIHRDLKPDNVMVGAYGEVQVMDWGLAKRIGNEKANGVPLTAEPDHSVSSASVYETMQGSIIGTPAYMPPEQASGKNADQRSDVFALGGMLCEILTGVPPFGNSSTTIAIERATHCDLENVLARLADCKCDSDIIELTRACLSPQPADRPTDANDLSGRLREIMACNEDKLRAAELNQARSVERLRAEKKRRKQLLWSAVLIGGVLLLTAAASVMFLFERNVRQAEQHERGLETARLRLADERELDSIIVRAIERSNAALQADNSQKLEKWEIAKTEIAHAKDLAATTESEVLRFKYESAKAKIESGLGNAISRNKLLEKTDQLQQAVDFVLDVSKHPEEFRKSLASENQSDALKRLDSTFEKLGVEKFAALDSTVKALESFEDRDLVVQSVLLWQIQSLNSSAGVQPGSPEYIQTRNWFFELSNAIDADPIRKALRQAYGDEQAILSLTDDRESTSSPLTCYWLAQMIQGTDQATRVKKLKFLRQAHVKHPDDIEINWQLGNFFEPDGWPAGCRISLRHMQVCYASQPENIGVLERLARMYHHLSERELAIEFGQRLVSLLPNSDYVNSLMAMIFAKQQMNDEAIEHARKALEINPQLIDPYISISRARCSQRNYEKALEALRKLEELHPNESLVQRERADIYLRTSRYEEALEEILEAEKQYPTEFWTMRLLAKIYQRNDKWQESIPVYQYMIQNFAANPIYQIGLAKAYLETGEPYLAENVLRQVWVKRKHIPLILKLMNKSLTEQGKPEEGNDTQQVID